jgi:hypothetical protein
MMTRVFCKGGPYYWIVEPETAFEKRLRHWREGLLPKRGKERFTRAEYLKARREYSDKHFLLPAEIYPMTPDEELLRRTKMTGPITLWRCAASAQGCEMMVKVLRKGGPA